MQSDRFFNALKGHGALSRLVVLPFESHGYASRESIMHVLWETDRWLQKFCVSNSTTEDDGSSKGNEGVAVASGGVGAVAESDTGVVDGLLHFTTRSSLW